MKQKNKKDSIQLLGIVLISVGGILFLNQIFTSSWLSSWLFNWRTIVFIIGLIVSVRSNFKNMTGVVLLIIGSLSLFKLFLGFSLFNYFTALVIVFLGFFFLNRGRNDFDNENDFPPPSGDFDPSSADSDEFYDWDKRVYTEDQEATLEVESDEAPPQETDSSSQKQSSQKSSAFTHDKRLKIDVVFSNIKRAIFSKYFQYGEFTVVFGSIDINFEHADIHNDQATVNVFILFGNAKITIPPHWGVSLNHSSILADINDKRFTWDSNRIPEKMLYITGATLFGSIAIRNS